MNIRSCGAGIAALALAASLASAPSTAQAFDTSGSFGTGGFSRYIPPVTNPLFNETPFITTELKPIYIYHSIPGDFLTLGGSVNVVAAQARLALSDRLGLIATSDGYSWINFDAGLSDANGWNDLAAGIKYALVSDPKAGSILTVGLRYTAPTGSINSGPLELNGTGSGYIDVFATAAKLFEKTQIQGSVGAQIALSDENWSFVHASVHVDHEIFKGVYPLIEANLFVPVDGGNVMPGLNLTGADIVDIGASDPETVLTLAIGARVRLADNILFGAAFEKNVLSHKILGIPGTEATVWDWRITTDLTIRF